jgi:D-proline reductase (dithiol) PrdB
MVRLADLGEAEAQLLAGLPCPTYDTARFVMGPPVSERRVAVISTAGLMHQGDAVFNFGAADYRVIRQQSDRPIVMGHVSVNFDRSGFQQDMNVVFPLDRLRELEARGEIGSVADFHYSFMGATDPADLEAAARSLGTVLKDDEVDAAILVPV